MRNFNVDIKYNAVQIQTIKIKADKIEIIGESTILINNMVEINFNMEIVRFYEVNTF